MSTIRTFSDFLVVYDWLKQWQKGSDLNDSEGGFHGSMGAILGIQAMSGIPVMYVARAEKRIKAVMIGWPAKEMSEEDSFPPLDPKGTRFYIRNMYALPKYRGKGLLGFGDDIVKTWPSVTSVVTLGPDGKASAIWEKTVAEVEG